jgi:hypothetical protein
VAVPVLAATVAAFLLLRGGDQGLRTLHGRGFSVSYPSSWEPLSQRTLRAAPGGPLAALKRKDRKGLVVIRREKGRTGGDLNRFASRLRRVLERRFPDFQGRSAHLIKVKAGKAFFLSYIRKRTGTVQSIVIVPVGRTTYTLNTVSSGRSKAAAREIGRIITSFGG